jgi:hypothetical protein
MYFVYIIYSAKRDRFYVGYTSDINSRLIKHNSGAGLINLQTKVNFPIITNKLNGELIGAWFRSDEERNFSNNMGVETSFALIYKFNNYLHLNLGISYADIGNYYTTDKNNITEVFSRFQFNL